MEEGLFKDLMYFTLMFIAELSMIAKKNGSNLNVHRQMKE